MNHETKKILILNVSPENASLSHYCYNLKKHFEKHKDCQIEFIDLYKTSNSYLERILKIIFYKNKKEFDYGFIPHPVLSKALANSKVKNKICIIHDIFPLQNMSLNNFIKVLTMRYLHKYIFNLNKLVFISRYSKSSFIDFFHRYPKHIRKNKVIYGGIDPIFFGKSKEQQKKYDFIHIARDVEHKNLAFILQILKHFKDKKLLRIGKISRKDELFIKENDLKVSIVEECSEEDKKRYFEESKILLFPSFYEGFGLPPIEAMASNCYVLSAANTGLLESNLEENLLPLEKNIWIDRINKIFSEEGMEILKKQKEFAQFFNIERFLNEFEAFVFEK